jgi:hypothetical protein
MELERAVHVLRLRWRSLVHRRDTEAQLADELAYHLAEEIDRRVARGETPDAARRAARAAFGGMERAKEACRDARGTAFIESVMRDLRVGARSLLRQPAFTVPAVLTLLLMRGLEHELHGVSPRDPLTYAGVVVTIALVTLVASFVPTRRAMRVDPLTALRGS